MPAIEDLFLMSNLSPKQTGLPFVVWVSPKGGARHDVRIKISRGPQAKPGEFITVTVRPDVREISGASESHLTTKELELVRQWVELNRDVLVRFWDGDIEYTADMLALLRAI